MPQPENLFRLDTPPPDGANEFFETLLRSDSGVVIERIISAGQTTHGWYEQDHDEWVALLQGVAKLEFAGGQIRDLSAGDYEMVPAGRRHRVAATSAEPPCIWVAVHLPPA